MTKVTNKRRPVVDTLLELVIARDKEFKRATTDIFDRVDFLKEGILKYLEIEDPYLVEFEALEMIGHDVVIQVTTPSHEPFDLLKGQREANLFTFSLPFEVVSTHEADTIAQYIDDMMDFDIDNIDELAIEEVNQLLDGCGTLKFDQVTRRIVH